MIATLGVHSFSYAPFAFFCFLSPIIAIIYGFLNLKIEYLPKDGAEEVEMPYAK